jgi:hypothetical protein
MKYNLIPIFLLLIFIILFNSSRHSSKEGFESYNNCVEQGYPMDFCIKTPIQSKVDHGYCSCADGYFGSWHMGEGKCYCYLFNGLLPHKITRPFESSPFN